MKFPKTLCLMALTLAVCLTLAGCMRQKDQTQAATPAPTATADYDTGTRATEESNSQGAQQSAQEAFDWSTRVKEIEDKIAQLSEIGEDRVVVSNTTALVGVKFNQAYQGEMTERIREMVAAQVMEADPNIQTVAVTAEEADVKEIYDLSDRLAAGENVDDMENDIQRIVRNATTLR